MAAVLNKKGATKIKDSDGNYIEDVAALVEYIVDKLKKSSTGMLAASELGGDIHRRSAWSSVIDNAGGLKLFCLDHADKIQWISSGSGHVKLVNTAVGRRASAMSGSAGVGILFQVATVFTASAPASGLVAHTLTVRSPGLQDGPPATVRYVVKDGPAANSARPPLPGDMLIKVDGYDVRGLSITELPPWISGEEGSVVTLSFEGANVRYDTSVVRGAVPAGISPDMTGFKWQAGSWSEFGTKRSESPCVALMLDDSAPTLFRGQARAVKVNVEARTVAFADKFTTLRSAQRCPLGGKGYYEIEILKNGSYPLYRFGFAAAAFAHVLGPSNDKVGDDGHSWAVSGLSDLLHPTKLMMYNAHKGNTSQSLLYICNQWKKGDVVGLACDLDSMRMHVSLNGKAPANCAANGVVFELAPDAVCDGLFAAFTGYGGEVRYNLGETPFRHARPAADFKDFQAFAKFDGHAVRAINISVSELMDRMPVSAPLSLAPLMPSATTEREDGKNRQDGAKIVTEVTTRLSVKQMKQILEAAGVNYSDCTEKNELEELLAKLRANQGMGCARASGGGRDSSEQKDHAGTTAKEDVKCLVKEQSKDSSTVSVETTNFARYCRLLMDVGREFLMTLFKENYRKEEGVQWEESYGPSFFGAKFPDRFSQSNLGKHLIDSICSGKCHEWDITLLSSLLIFTPGYIKGDASGKKAVEALRKERNDLAHDAHVLARLSLTEEQFQIKWEIVSASLKVLIELLPGDKAAWRIKIDSIAKEEMGKSALKPLFERVKEDMQHILDDLEDVRDKAGEAMRMAEGAARMSKVAALDAKIEKLESLLNKQGHVDQDRLPRDVVLSNQKRYRLLKQVGKGGMGTVFEAKLIAADSNHGKLALKICDAEASGRAEREAQILKRLSELNHDNIVKFFDSAFEDLHLVIIMELIKGQALDEWLERRYSPGNSGVTFTEAQPIVKQLVQGMSAVHAIDIAHRDLKPANLVFDEVTGKLVIVDFGLSKQHNTNTTVTAANCQLGTLLYMSPEQFKGDVKEISFSSDVWAIGVLWHEMLTSHTPFEPASTQAHADSSAASKRRSFSKWEEKEMMDKVAEKGARKLPLLEVRNVPSQIIGTIAKCLCFETKDRYRDAQELFHQIEGVFQELENKPAGMESADSVKPFKSWCASEVAELVRSIGSAFADKANQIEANGIDGDYFWAMLKNNDPDLTTSVEDGGLGFSRLQVNRVGKKIEELG